MRPERAFAPRKDYRERLNVIQGQSVVETGGFPESSMAFYACIFDGLYVETTA